LLVLIAAGTATAVATGIGAIPVFFLGTRTVALRPMLLGLAAGVMGVASVAGLLLPGLEEGSAASVGAGLAIGILFLVVASRALEARQRHRRRALSSSMRTSILVFAVLFVHSLPEGFAIGTAYASDVEGLSLFVIVAIAIQNIPEGTSVALPMAAAGISPWRQFWAAVASSLPQPVGAVVAYVLVEQIQPLLPVSFGFAAGAMLALVASELLPSALRESVPRALAGATAGALAMLAFSAALGV
jgi:ZIP family zinc transporter